MRVCTECGEERPEEAFTKVSTRCAECKYRGRLAASRRWKDRNRGYLIEYNKQWSAANPERARESSRKALKAWRARNRELDRERSREYRRRYYLANPDKESAKARAWEKKNWDRVLERARRLGKLYREKYPERQRERVMRRLAAKRRLTPPWVTARHIEEMRALYALASRDLHVDHIYPLQGKNAWGLHVPWNLQLLPAKLNCSKGAKAPDLWSMEGQ